MDVTSDKTIPAFGGHATIHTQKQIDGIPNATVSNPGGLITCILFNTSRQIFSSPQYTYFSSLHYVYDRVKNRYKDIAPAFSYD
jgi:hypothetical protein